MPYTLKNWILQFTCCLTVFVGSANAVCVDLYRDDFIDLLDYSEFAYAWQQTGNDIEADFVPDGIVNLLDLAYLSSLWLTPQNCSQELPKFYVTESIDALRLLIPYNADTAYVAGYQAAQDGGGGLYTFNAHAAQPDNNGTVIAPKYHVPGRWVRHGQDQLSVKCFGAKGDGLSDDTAAIQAAIHYAQDAKIPSVYIPGGSYLVTSTIVLTDPCAHQPNLIGAGASAAFLKMSPAFPSNAPMLLCNQLDGTVYPAQISGITFQGHQDIPDEVAICLTASKAVTISDCRFVGSIRYGVRFHNADNAAPAQDNLVKHCEFGTSCTALHYYRTGLNSEPIFRGNGIMHGSTTHAGSGQAVIEIEDASSSTPQARLLHTPLTLIAFAWTADQTIFTSNVEQVHSAYGHIATEGVLPTIAQGQGKLLLDGYLMGHGDLRLGNCLPRNVIVRDFGQAVTWRPQSHQHLPMQSPITTIPTGVMPNWSALYYVKISNAGYDHRYLIVATHQASGGPGFVQVLAAMKTNDALDVGPPIFSVNNSGRLEISNPNYDSTFTVDLYKTPLAAKYYGVTN